MISVLLFARTVDRSLNHDEHQFIVPAVLLSRDGLLLYRDYPLFHLPNLVLIYAALDRLTHQPILGPKLLSFASSFLVLVAIFVTAVRSAAPRRQNHAFALASGMVLMLSWDPLFLYTMGKTWNHEFPTLLVVLSVLAQTAAARRNSIPLLCASAAAAGIAVGCRLTFAPYLVPMALSTFLFAGAFRRRLALSALYTVVTTAALAPSLYFLAAHREAFLFGNFEFPRLRLLDPENTRIQKTMTWSRKLRYFLKEVLLPSWPLFAAYLLLAVRPAVQRLNVPSAQQQVEASIGVAVVLLVLPFLLLGCFAPSRYQYQHYFALAPVLALGIAFGIQTQLRHLANRIGFACLILFVSSLSLAIYKSTKDPSASPLSGLNVLAHSDEWFSSRARAAGAELRKYVPGGKVLTLAPSAVVSGGLAIYPEFATGPFAWRSAQFVAPERRRLLHLVAPADLDQFLASDPPAAILTGVEDEALEVPLISFAKSHGFQQIALSRRRQLWLPPQAP